MKDLDALLSQGEPERTKTTVNNELDSLHITEYAFEKARAYARLAVQKARRTIECGGYLIAPKYVQDRTATDAFLARNQDVREGLFTIEAEDVIKAGREINGRGYRVLGWWHSHGNLRTFFSPTDNGGQRTVLNEISAFNYITQRDEKEVGNLEVRAEDGKIVMFDRRSPGRKYEIEVDGNPTKISIAALKLQQEKRIGFAYGLVVNTGNRESYAEIATRDLCGFCRNSEDKSVQVDITLFDAGKFDIDEDALMAEIKERVKMRKRFSRYFIEKTYYGGGQRQSPLFTQQTLFTEDYGCGYPTREDDDFYREEFGTPAPSPNHQKPIIPLPDNPQPIKDDTPSDKTGGSKQESPTQNKFDNFLNGEGAEEGNSIWEDDSK